MGPSPSEDMEVAARSNKLKLLAVAAGPRLLEDLEQADADLAAGRSRPIDELIAELDAEENSA